MIELIFTKGPRAGERFPVEAERLSIGRLEECDIELNQPNVSRKHAVIKREGERISIIDNRSGNGTFVNGKRVTQTGLRNGDVVRIGDHTIRVEKRAKSVQKANQGPMTVKEILAEPPTRRELISRFFIEDQSGQPRRLEFAGDKLSLGRGEKCKVVLEDDELSRLHAQITHRAGCFEVRDVGSANGTYLNGAPVIEAEIKDGDTLEMGSLVIGARIVNTSLHLAISKKPEIRNPLPVKKLKDSRPLPLPAPEAALPTSRSRPRYTIVTGLVIAVAVALLLIFVGRTYAAERPSAPRARIDAAQGAVYSTCMPRAILLAPEAQATTNN